MKKKQKLQIGVIGTGMIAQRHMENFAADRRSELRWVADIDAKALKQSAETFSVPNAATDYKALLGDPALDAVVVCTPPVSHCQIGLDVMRAEKHLILEKPLALTVDEANRLLREAQERPKLMVTGCSCRHARLNPKFPFVRKLIESGKLGRVYHIHHRMINRQGRGGIEYNPKAKWFLDRKRAGGGPLYDWGVYDLSFHLGVVGQPEFLRAEAFCANGLDAVDPGTPHFTVEEHGGALMRFQGGLTYYWERANNAHNAAPNQTSIYGTKGGLRFDYISSGADEVEYFYVDRGGRGKAKSRTLKVNLSRHKGDMPELGRAIIRALLDGGPPPMPLEIEVQNLAIIHSVYKAAQW